MFVISRLIAWGRWYKISLKENDIALSNTENNANTFYTFPWNFTNQNYWRNVELTTNEMILKKLDAVKASQVDQTIVSFLKMVL